MDFFARQEAARRTTRWLLVAFLVSVVLVVARGRRGGGVRCSAPPNPDASPAAAVLGTSVVVLAIICGASLFKTLSLRAGGGAVARSLGGTRIERSTGDLALKRLHNVVEEMAIASGVTMPEVYVLENEDGINAFAAGNSPADAAIAVTRGAATRLKRDELQGVIAHEFSHILNGDMRLNLRLLGWTFGLAGRRHRCAHRAAAARRTPSRGSRKDGAGALMLAALAVMVLGYIGVFFGRLLQAAVSRQRERLADASAVQFTRNPTGLAGALLKIAGTSSGSRLVTPEAEEVAHMLFAAGLPRLFATHPPLEERLKALDPVVRDGEPAGAGGRGRARCGAAARRGHVAHPASARTQQAPTHSRRHRDRSVRGSAAHGIAALAGTMASENVRYAQSARDAVPEGLRDFVRVRRSRARAGAGGAGQQGSRGADRSSAASSRARMARSSRRGCSACRHSPIPCRPRCACPPCSSCFRRCAGCRSRERQQLRDVVARARECRCAHRRVRVLPHLVAGLEPAR